MKIGASRISITPEPHELPITLLGWGDPQNLGKKIEEPIHARAMAFESPDGSRLIFVCAEICFLTESIRQGVMKKLKEEYGHLEFREDEIVLTATHTHNAPGGYCHSVLYNIPSKGYHATIYHRFVSGCVEAILKAWNSRIQGSLSFAQGEIPLDQPVAFNRSLESWNQNPDVTRYSKAERNRALDRTMSVLVAYDDHRKPIGLISWFAVHCTSIHRDFMGIHSDNKGLASKKVEAAFERQGFHGIALFAQGAAGDVSPNFKRYWFKREVRGAYRDDLKSCDSNAQIQADFALQLMNESRPVESTTLASTLAYHDMTSIPIPPEWVNGQTGIQTAPGMLGCPFMAGTAEGSSNSIVFIRFLEFILAVLAFIKGKKFKTRAHGNKTPAIELVAGRVFGDSNPADLPIPGFFDPAVQIMKFWSKTHAFKGEPLTPTILPIQLFQIGELGFAALPGEFTTQSGVRMRKLLEPILEKKGIRKLILSGYANSYAGYVTTAEEYQLQKYEGASTHFGLYTLLGYMAIFRQLAERWANSPLSGKPIPELNPPKMKSESYLKKISVELFRKRFSS